MNNKAANGSQEFYNQLIFETSIYKAEVKFVELGKSSCRLIVNQLQRHA